MVLIFRHVSLKDGVQWSQKSHKAISVNRCHFNIRLGNNIGSARLTLEQGSLTKVITWIILFDLLGFGTRLHALSCNSLALNQKVEVVASVTLCDDRGASGVGLLFDCISYFRSFVVVHSLENRHRL